MVYGVTATGKILNEKDIFIEMTEVTPVSKKIEVINREIRELETQIEIIQLSKSYRTYKFLNDYKVLVFPSLIVTCAMLAYGIFMAILKSPFEITEFLAWTSWGATAGCAISGLIYILNPNTSLSLEKLKKTKEEDKHACLFVDTFRDFIQDPTETKLREIFIQFSKYPVSRLSFPYSITEPSYNWNDCRDILNLQILKQIHFSLSLQKIQTEIAIFSLTQEAFISEICSLNVNSLDLFKLIGLPMPSLKAASYFIDNHEYLNGIGSIDKINKNMN